MNFQTILEELDKLYEEDQKQKTQAVSADQVENNSEATAEESKPEKALTEAADDEEIDETIVDDEAEAEDESAIEDVPGQLILECENCGGLVIKAEADVAIDEETGLADADEACQYCEEAKGYKILGKVAPYEEDVIDIEDDEVIKEGIFDSKAKKEKAYQEAIEEIFGKTAPSALASEVATSAADLVRACADTDNSDDHTAKTLAKNIITMIKNAKTTINKTPHSLIKKIISLGAKYAPTAYETDELEDFMSKVTKLQTSTKIGYKAMEYLLSKVNQATLAKLNQTIEFLKKEHGIVESVETVEDENEINEGIFDKFKSNKNNKAQAQFANKNEPEKSAESSEIAPEQKEAFTTYTYDEWIQGVEAAHSLYSEFGKDAYKNPLWSKAMEIAACENLYKDLAAYMDAYMSHKGSGNFPHKSFAKHLKEGIFDKSKKNDIKKTWKEVSVTDIKEGDTVEINGASATVEKAESDKGTAQDTVLLTVKLDGKDRAKRYKNTDKVKKLSEDIEDEELEELFDLNVPVNVTANNNDVAVGGLTN